MSSWKIVLDSSVIDEANGDWQLAALICLLRNEQETHFDTKHYVDENGKTWFKMGNHTILKKLHGMTDRQLQSRMTDAKNMGIIETCENWIDRWDKTRLIHVSKLKKSNDTNCEYRNQQNVPFDTNKTYVSNEQNVPFDDNISAASIQTKGDDEYNRNQTTSTNNLNEQPLLGDVFSDLSGQIEKPKKKRATKTVFIPPTVEDMIEYFKTNGYSEASARKAHMYYSSANWVDASGKPVLNWKQKMIMIWFKDENKLVQDKPKTSTAPRPVGVI